MTNVMKIDFRKPVEMNGERKVLLRQIHEELGVKKTYTQWAEQQLKMFEENHEFGSLTLEGKQTEGRGGQNKVVSTLNTSGFSK